MQSANHEKVGYSMDAYLKQILFFHFPNMKKTVHVLNKYLYYTYMYLNTKDNNYPKLAL